MKIDFKRGIPGVEHLKEFDLNDIEGNDKFKVLKALKEEISFLVISPFDCCESYEINLDQETVRELKIEEPSDVLMLNIVTLGGSIETSTANLKAPLVINVKNNLGKQFIMQNDTYSTKHPLVRREENVGNY